MTRRWPDSLVVPVGRGSRLDLADTARRTEFETAVRARRITTVRRDRPTLAARLTDAEFAAFRAWWGDEPWSLAGASDSLAGWTLTGAARTAEGAIGPDEVACDLLTEDTGTGAHRAARPLAAAGWAAGDTCAATVSLLPLGRSMARVGIVGRDGTFRFLRVDLAAVAILSNSGCDWAEVAPHRGWVRVRLVAPVGSGSETPALRIAADNGSGTDYTGSGAAALAVAQVNARAGGREAAIFVPTRADGSALGTAGGSAWFRCPLAAGGGFVRREVLPLGPAQATPLPSLNWEVLMPVEARDA